MILQITDQAPYGIIGEDEQVKLLKWKYLVIPFFASMTLEQLEATEAEIKQFMIDHFADYTVVHVSNNNYMLWIVS